MKMRTLLKNKNISVIIASGIPVSLGLVSVPLIIRNLGTENFGIFSLALALLGFSSAMDLGMSRLLPTLISKSSKSNDHNEAFSFALTLVATVSVLVALLATYILWYHSADIFGWTLQKTLKLRGPFIWIILSAPLLAITGTIRGGFEGLGRFDIANRILIFSSSVGFLIPALTSFFTINVEFAFFVVFIARASLVTTLFIYLARILKIKFHFKGPGRMGRDSLWITLSSILSPALVYSDRFLVSAQFTLTQIAFYATPIDLVLRVLILPQALSRVMLPTFAAAAIDDRVLVTQFRKSLFYMLFLCGPILFIMGGFSQRLLALWAGAEFATESSLLLSICTLGIFWNCLTWVTFNGIQAVGRFHSLTLIQIASSIIYLTALVLLRQHGLILLASLWSLRFLMDAIFLSFNLAKWCPPLRQTLNRLFGIYLLGFVAWAPFFIDRFSEGQRHLYTLGIVVTFLVIQKRRIREIFLGNSITVAKN
jgi:O-antigen/teichoic acid export membrane protein